MSYGEFDEPEHYPELDDYDSKVAQDSLRYLSEDEVQMGGSCAVLRDPGFQNYLNIIFVNIRIIFVNVTK